MNAAAKSHELAREREQSESAYGRDVPGVATTGRLPLLSDVVEERHPMRSVNCMSSLDVRTALARAHRERYAVRVRTVTAGGRAVDMEGHVTAVRADGEIRFLAGDPESGPVHDLSPGAVLDVKRVRSAG